MEYKLTVKSFFFTVLAVSAATQVPGEIPTIPRVQESSFEDTLARHFCDTRADVARYSHDHSGVLNGFRIFAEELEHSGMSQNDLHRILDAVSFMAEKHQYQTRKSPDQPPYIIHTIGVAIHLLTIGQVRDADTVIGALLHDTVEDTQTTFEEIHAHFGKRVEGFIQEVTDDKSLPKARRKELQIEDASHKSVEAAQIKLADKLYNLTDLSKNPPSDWDKQRIDEYFQWSQNVVNGLPRCNPALKEAVDATIDAYWKKS